MTEKKEHIYFASDMHLGMHPEDSSKEREKLVVQWLHSIEHNAKELWLLGDVFDYWFEYKKVVPRGFIRFIGKLADLADKGTEIHIFPGNHDVWFFDYFPDEIGAKIHHDPVIIKFGNKTFYLSHGDGLTKKDRIYLLIKSMFRNKFLQWCYARIHPNGSSAFAQWWSRKSRYSKDMVHPFKGEENEEQILFSISFLEKNPGIDLFIFGHRHVPYDINIGNEKRVVCLGDWISNFTYGIFDGTEFRLEKFSHNA
ncbi:MAG: UDP-2,3-diacylglucosamine diphosphatase [Bacteroidales bacterium]|nr:UDP-2,3-diacylglucosamine diphosphatase [Bacteroidales bacterium]